MVQGERWEEEHEFMENVYWEMEHGELIERRMRSMAMTWGNPEVWLQTGLYLLVTLVPHEVSQLSC